MFVACHLPPPGEQHAYRQLKQFEWTVPGPLLDPGGELQQPGWGRKNFARWQKERISLPASRLRQWEFYTVMNRRFAVNITIADIGFAGFCSVDAIRFSDGLQVAGAIGMLRPEGDIQLPDSSWGPVRCRSGSHTYAEVRVGQGKRYIKLDFPGNLFSDSVQGKLIFSQPSEREYFAGMIPFDSDRREFFYENKIPGMPAAGKVVIGDDTFDFAVEKSWAVMDWGRGIWPQKLVWRWAVGMGEVEGVPVSFNLGMGFGDTKNGTENILFVNGKSHKLTYVNWHFDRGDLSKPWRFDSPDGRLTMTFTPRYDQKVNANFLIKGIKLNKVYGLYEGTAILDDGRVLTFGKLPGFAEEVYIRW